MKKLTIEALERTKHESGPFQDLDTIVQHDKIHLEDYLFKIHVFKKKCYKVKKITLFISLWYTQDNSKKIKPPIYFTVVYSRKFRNFLVLKHGEIKQEQFILAQHGEIKKNHGEIKKTW